jgi:aryl-alcohol dehydrogenase-like predicted oxidoreductase
MSLTGFYGKSFDEPSALAAVQQAIDLGATLFDTADVYSAEHGGIGYGGNERFIGKAIAGRREQVFLATKGSIVNPEVCRPGEKPVRGDPEFIHAACDASLMRLGTDYIDIYFYHRFDPTVPIEETVGAMGELVTAGKVRHLGLSATSAEMLRRAVGVHPIIAIQNEWALWTRDIEAEIVPTARALGVGIIAYAPLGRGFLTGLVRSEADLGEVDHRRESPRFRGENFARNLSLVDQLAPITAELRCTTGQLALAWLHAQGDDVVPIPGAETPNQVAENVAATEIELSRDVVAGIDAIFTTNAISGDRYWPERAATMGDLHK